MELSFGSHFGRFILVNPQHFALNIVVCQSLFINCFDIFKERLVIIIHESLQLIPPKMKLFIIQRNNFSHRIRYGKTMEVFK